MTLLEWQKYRQSFREQVQREISEAVDAGRGALPINIAIQDAVIRNLIDRVVALENSPPNSQKRGNK